MCDVEKEIYLEIHNPLLGGVEDAEAWVEQSFLVPVSYQPNEYYENGIVEHWYVDGDIIDEDGYRFDESEIDDLYNDCNGETSGFDWDALMNEVAEERAEVILEGRIESYEHRMEAYHDLCN